ncbi:hypothetical protein [Streptomyces sp. AK02-01A]|uniref:hypothetical protein n=1 Tax=Streptomyces sp. AK02-01A TaxID=3028648 RepID=UPI0029B6A584|nr:hypothetical protein [Streptomyces sp. AK02-01A]MDX3854165.1 hypothetical protein [Streptomyces sp. AK02-01A]
MTSFYGRFRDPRSTAYDFIDSIFVKCPNCANVAHVVPAPQVSDGERPTLFTLRRLVCRSCGLSRKSSGGHVAFARGTNHPAIDPYFGVALWLQLETRHGWLWAYNLEHLDLIRRFVRATLRERAPWYDTGQKMTLVARLPLWIKQARNRDEVLRTINRISATLVHA